MEDALVHAGREREVEDGHVPRHRYQHQGDDAVAEIVFPSWSCERKSRIEDYILDEEYADGAPGDADVVVERPVVDAHEVDDREDVDVDDSAEEERGGVELGDDALLQLAAVR